MATAAAQVSAYRTGIPVHRLFEEHAGSTPSATAVVCGTTRLTYRQLDSRAAAVAGRLRRAGLPAGGLVAVSMGRSADVLVAMLGVLKAGGAYAPIEPSSPEPLLRHLLADADPFAVLTHDRHRVRLDDGSGRPLICLDHPEPPEDAPPPAQDADPAAGLACVFYTSGSTGLPKGAMIDHRNLVNAYYAWEEVYGLTAGDRYLQTTTFEFDVFTADWIRALGSGGTLVMADRNFTLDRTADIAELHHLVVDQAITVMECNVYTLRRLHQYIRPRGLALGSVRLLSVGAEKWYLDEHIELQQYLGPGVRHINSYGVAEATVDSTYFELTGPPPAGEQADRISLIGRPFPNTRIHILAEDGSPAAPGQPGEICIGGPGVGRGYLGRPDLTAERFPEVDFDPAGRIYRTGDIGRLRHDGTLEYIGRMDFRVEIGSERIEVAEIEAALRRHPLVQDCLITAVQTGPRTSVLVAYVEIAPGQHLGTKEVRDFLLGQLPELMIPRAVVQLRALPRTRAGKVDRTSLPQPALPAPNGYGIGKGTSGKATPPAEDTDSWSLFATLLVVIAAAAILIAVAKG